MNKVYIINKAGHNYSRASDYGEVVFCTTGTQDRFNTNNMFRTFSEIFDKSEAEDLILLTSLSIMCSVACAIFSRKHGRLNLLLFKNNKYIRRDIMIDQGLSRISVNSDMLIKGRVVEEDGETRPG